MRKQESMAKDSCPCFRRDKLAQERAGTHTDAA